jgi:hypothetical protein
MKADLHEFGVSRVLQFLSHNVLMTDNYTGVSICHYCNYYVIYNAAKLSYYSTYTLIVSTGGNAAMLDCYSTCTPNSTEQLVAPLLAACISFTASYLNLSVQNCAGLFRIGH